MLLLFADVLGTSWMTFQCSTTLPSSRRKKSASARPGSPGFNTRWDWVATRSPPANEVGAKWRGVLVRGDCQSGCPIMAVSIGAGVSDSLHATAGEALAEWQSALAENLRVAGLPEKRSSELAGYPVAGWLAGRVR